ncbi:NAD-dependent epimerase/dehydratase family protein [Acetobacter okinawensis]|uniref:NAD-dependent epimerase/dehydratase family protein n=1 Tax=Acetobacter okinawensis TaxID=1076594 RepID=UPI001F57C45F|nr:NAD-dependent epimerase/dehydratase family protein [Acetobacter okinawensis]
MKIFVTGATGFIGSSIVDELLRRGHAVVGLARSDASATKLQAKGAQAHRGSIYDAASIVPVLNEVDGVIHAAFNHDFSTYAQNCLDDGVLLERMAESLRGSGKPLIATSGTTVIAPGHLATEDQPADPAIPRSASERFLRFHEFGVRTGSVRLPPSVHGEGDTAFVPAAIALARRAGVSAYIAMAPTAGPQFTATMRHGCSAMSWNGARRDIVSTPSRTRASLSACLQKRSAKGWACLSAALHLRKRQSISAGSRASPPPMFPPPAD